MYLKNIETIASINQSLVEAITNAQPLLHVDVVYTTRDLPIPIVRKDGFSYALHSKFDPIKEAQRLVDDSHCEGYDCIVVLGFGFAYHIDVIRKKAKSTATILILEKYPEIIKEAIRHRDLRDLFKDPRVVIVLQPTEEMIADYMKGRSSYKTVFITHRGSHQIDPEGYTNLQRIAKAYIATKEVNIATLAKFERLWTSNIARNIKEIILSPPAKAFFNTCENIPAIVVNAGPSLEESISYIKQYQGNCVIIAVDTSLKVLEYYDIEPHFCITVDPQLINARYFEGCKSRRTILIADPMVHPSTFWLYKGRKAITGVAFEMMKWIEQAVGEYGTLRYGGSVSTNAYDFAKRLGARPIILVGQDLAFTKGLAHVKGAYLDQHIFFRNSRLYTVEMFNRMQLTALPKILVKGIRTSFVHTNQKMMIFLSWFSKLQDNDLINATYDGAFINDVKHASFGDLEKESLLGEQNEYDIWKIVEEAYDNSMPSSGDINERKLKLVGQLQQMFGQTNEMLPLVKRAIQYAEKLLNAVHNNRRSVGEIINNLDEIDKKILRYSVAQNIIGLTIQHVIHTITEGYELPEAAPNEYEAIAQRSLFLYKGLEEGVQYSSRIIQTMMALLQQL